MSALEKMGALWCKQDKKGMVYFTGNVDGLGKVVIFKNMYKKEGSNEPDYRVFKGKEDAAPQQNHSQVNKDKFTEDDLPF